MSNSVQKNCTGVKLTQTYQNKSGKKSQLQNGNKKTSNGIDSAADFVSGMLRYRTKSFATLLTEGHQEIDCPSPSHNVGIK